MKTFKQLRNELSKLHNEIAMKDVETNEEEDILDEICEKLLKSLTLLDSIDNGN